MKATIYSITGQKKSEIELPSQFSEKIRPNLIKRAVLAMQANTRQPYGSDPIAGTRQGYATSKRRHRYGTTYGIGISRIKRKAMWRRGMRFGWVGAFVGNAVKGLKNFPPEAGKNQKQKINKKERRFALRSAIAATASKDLVAMRNHKIEKLHSLPLIVESGMESLSKTKQVEDLLKKLNLEAELERTNSRRIRAGVATFRGRKYRIKKGPLFVVSKKCALMESAKNIMGVEVSLAKELNAELLAPGSQAGRLVIWSEDSIKEIKEKRLFA